MNQDLSSIVIALVFIGIGFTVITMDSRINDLENKITSIQAIPGPQGDQGPTGDQGPAGDQGPQGETGATGPAGTCTDCKCPSGQYVTGFKADGSLICTGSVSSAAKVVTTTTTRPTPTRTPTPTPFIPPTLTISCITSVDPSGMYACTVKCPSGVVQVSTIWITGETGKFVSADSLDSPNTLTCFSEGPATCGATCI